MRELGGTECQKSEVGVQVFERARSEGQVLETGRGGPSAAKRGGQSGGNGLGCFRTHGNLLTQSHLDRLGVNESRLTSIRRSQ
jgi:hypothetical protein